MGSKRRLAKGVFTALPVVDSSSVTEMLERELHDFNRKIIVLDDDPTGVQTIHQKNGKDTPSSRNVKVRQHQ